MKRNIPTIDIRVDKYEEDCDKEQQQGYNDADNKQNEPAFVWKTNMADLHLSINLLFIHLVFGDLGLAILTTLVVRVIRTHSSIRGSHLVGMILKVI